MKRFIFLLVMVLVATGCREKYVSPAISPTTGYLVVEGFINTAGTTTIRLTRTSKLSDTATLYEKKATVSIQSETGANYILPETTNGIYSASPTLALNTNYRLRIATAAGKEYLSAYTTPKTTPLIDSIGWERTAAGVQISVHAKGTASQEKYYQWKTEETWEYQADYSTKYKWVLDASKTVIGITLYDPVSGGNNNTAFKCWGTDNSNTILLGSTENQPANIVHQPLFSIQQGSIKLNILYSVNIKQYSVSKEDFLFLTKIKKNTEQLGTIFDAQPSEIKGNISCTSTPGEIVIGFIEATQEQQRRIFISALQVPGWNYRSGCEPYIVDLTNMGSIRGADTSSQPLDYVVGQSATLIKDVCVDCTKRGGTTKKPAFWP